jgi:hypothetical protein
LKDVGWHDPGLLAPSIQLCAHACCRRVVVHCENVALEELLDPSPALLDHHKGQALVPLDRLQLRIAKAHQQDGIAIGRVDKMLL